MNHFTSAIIAALFGFVSLPQSSQATLSAKEQAEVKRTLEDFQAGQISLDKITVDRDEAWGRELIAYYVTHTNEVTTKMILPIARCYGGFGAYPQAALLAKQYVDVYSNDWHGWRIVGSANLFMKHFGAALSAYTNAVRLGDDISYAPLGFSALKTGRLDIVSNMVPRFLALKDANVTTNRNQAIQLATVLVIYSLRTEQKDIFVKALGGIRPKDILKHDDVTFLVRQGCKEFSGKDIDKIRQELERAPEP